MQKIQREGLFKDYKDYESEGEINRVENNITLLKREDNIYFTPLKVVKRNGKFETFNQEKIFRAIHLANEAVNGEDISTNDIKRLYGYILKKLNNKNNSEKLYENQNWNNRDCENGNENENEIVEFPTVEEIQNAVEESLISFGFSKTAKAFIIYREEHRKLRDMEYDLMKVYKEITFKKSIESDGKRENANIDSDSAMGTMLKYGSEGSKYFVDKYILPVEIAKAHKEGDIHIHDKDFYMLTETCCQINLRKLFENGFSTGHGTIKSPQSIGSYASLACIILQANQNEMHGGQAIPDFDYAMEEGVNKSFRKIIVEELNDLILHIKDDVLNEYLKSSGNGIDSHSNKLNSCNKEIIDSIENWSLDEEEEIFKNIKDILFKKFNEEINNKNIDIELEVNIIKKKTYEKLRKEVYQAMQALVHNLNTMNSRAGAQVPFSSINYGTSVKEEGRMVVRELLNVTLDGIGVGETPIFPVQIFKVKDGINFKKGDKNFDLFELSMKTSAKRLYPNFSFLDATFNKQYYKEGHPETEVAYMGCRTRVMGNIYKEEEITYGRGNLSFTSINLPRLGIMCNKDIDLFFKLLDERMDLVKEQLLHRFKIQCNKKLQNYPFLMGEGVWINSDKLSEDSDLYEVLKHGTLSIGFIGLAESLKAILGVHHGESTKAQDFGLRIINHMRNYLDKISLDYNLNFSLIATPAEGLSGRFVKIDREKFGIIDGITDREYYTNSFHIPVYYKISMAKKLELEGKYHELTNGGHISYVEVDGDISKNPDAFYKILKIMKESNIGYGSINHPVDYDPRCNYTGIIDDVCPKCKRRENDGEPFHRIRRITGYLVGTLDRFNDAKKNEVNDRVKHL